MPVLVTPSTSKVRLQFQTGVNGEGKPVYKTKTISKIKTNAADQDVLDVALTLAGLAANTLNAVSRINESDLAEQA